MNLKDCKALRIKVARLLNFKDRKALLIEVARLRGELKAAEHEMLRLDDKWLNRFREQAKQQDERTKLIRRQLHILIEMAAKTRTFTSPTMFIKENKK